eukprot:CAMPEP_0113597446 /NCGR_PEP_ID=MMETSP0015_2-20120614/41006_1 /TAXON_ID=2838 /ORGANISM="Odontella" /LENGTH=371 /DNA_ID=CAMNT_0000505293 /DNA_START=79 /DNA_END=1195 /DNA_ORIENTATION=+ /assembly_acc=CAM_ASM_000160
MAKEHDSVQLVDNVPLHMDDDALIERDTRLLKEEYYNATGQELTDQDITNALSKALHEKLAVIFKTGNFTAFARDAKTDNESSEKDRRRMQEQGYRRVQSLISRNRAYFYISGDSPGYEWNYGRNEFYCLAIKKFRRGKNSEVKLKRNEPLTLKNCKDTRIEEMVTSYQNDYKVTMNQMRNPFSSWCLTVKKVEIGQQLRVDHCNSDTATNGNQKWSIFKGFPREGGQVMKPKTATDLCVTLKPPKSGKRGGGKATLQKCATQSEKDRNSQAMISCEATTSNSATNRCKYIQLTPNAPKMDYLECDIGGDVLAVSKVQMVLRCINVTCWKRSSVIHNSYHCAFRVSYIAAAKNTTQHESAHEKDLLHVTSV